MARSRGDQTVITLLLALVLIVAGMLAVDGWRRTREPGGPPPAARPVTVAETPREETPAPPAPPARKPATPARTGGDIDI